MSKQYPKCHFCHEEIVEGESYKRYKESEPMYVCFDCLELIGAICGDALPQLLRTMASNAEDSGEEYLKTWGYEEVEAE